MKRVLMRNNKSSFSGPTGVQVKLVHVDIRAQGTNYKGLGKVKCFMVVSNRSTGS